MRIAVSMRRICDPRHGEMRDALSVDWSRFINRTWPEATMLPAVNAPERVEFWADSLDPDALILTNGNDWGKEEDRDATETKLVAWFRQRNRPILGVCRGFQVLNLLLGGKLERDLHDVVGNDHAGTRHEINLVAQSYRILAGTDALVVNSYHDQGVIGACLAPGLRPVATADGDVVEAFDHPDEPILAIQWHPERPGGPTDFNRQLLRQFLCGDRA